MIDSVHRLQPGERPVSGNGFPVLKKTVPSWRSMDGIDQIAAPPSAASAGLPHERMYGTWVGSGNVHVRQSSFPVFASKASRCPRNGLSPPLGAEISTPLV